MDALGRYVKNRDSKIMQQLKNDSDQIRDTLVVTERERDGAMAEVAKVRLF